MQTARVRGSLCPSVIAIALESRGNGGTDMTAHLLCRELRLCLRPHSKLPGRGTENESQQVMRTPRPLAEFVALQPPAS